LDVLDIVPGNSKEKETRENTKPNAKIASCCSIIALAAVVTNNSFLLLFVK
jgi:hypothetical protein